MKATQENLTALERKMRKLWYNQEKRYGSARAWESPRFCKYEIQWGEMVKVMGGVDYTIWDVLA